MYLYEPHKVKEGRSPSGSDKQVPDPNGSNEMSAPLLNTNSSLMGLSFSDKVKGPSSWKVGVLIISLFALTVSVLCMINLGLANATLSPSLGLVNASTSVSPNEMMTEQKDIIQGNTTSRLEETFQFKTHAIVGHSCSKVRDKCTKNK